jgi:hypothetical protein
MTFRLTIGIDPGLSGAIAAVADGTPAQVFDMPTRPRRSGKGREIDARALQAQLRGLLHAHNGAAVTVVLEVVGGFTGRGASMSFAFGQADGALRAVLACLNLEPVEVYPVTWTGHFGLRKPKGAEKAPGKDASRALVARLYPDRALPVLRAKDDGRAEALLLALWAEQTEACAA